MKRRVFISYQHADQLKAKGLNLLSYAKNVELEFTGRHLLDPVKSSDPDYVRSKIKEQLKGSSVTVVLIGRQTSQSQWVKREIEWSMEKGNGLVGIKLDPRATEPKVLHDAGAEILDWNKPADVRHFQPAIEAAARGADVMRKAVERGTGSGASCGRRAA
jgi:MTH538 TIR-like domain (DUF1863)